MIFQKIYFTENRKYVKKVVAADTLAIIIM